MKARDIVNGIVSIGYVFEPLEKLESRFNKEVGNFPYEWMTREDGKKIGVCQKMYCDHGHRYMTIEPILIIRLPGVKSQEVQDFFYKRFRCIYTPRSLKYQTLQEKDSQ